MYTPETEDSEMPLASVQISPIHPRRSLWPPLAIFILSLFGLAVSIYMFEIRNSTKPSFCELSARISCKKLEESPFSTILRVPLPLFGIMWFLVMGGLSWTLHEAPSVHNAVAVLTWSASGVLFVFYLLGVELILGVLCPLCTIVHICILSVFGISLSIVLSHNCSLHPGSLMDQLQLSKVCCLPFFKCKYQCVIAVVVLFLLPIVIFNVFNMNGTPEHPSTMHHSTAADITLAKCLNSSNIEMFGDSRCSHCTEQKELFGEEASKELNFWDCGVDTVAPRCAALQIKAYPTWVRLRPDGTEERRLVGETALATLAKWAACSYAQNEQ